MLFSDGNVEVARLCKAGEGCDLCDFVSRTVNVSFSAIERDIHINRVGSVLKYDGRRIFRLCLDPS